MALPWWLVVISLLGGATCVTHPWPKTECGHVSAKEQPLINSINAVASEAPWYVGIFLASDNSLQICGGTLVHPRVVVTAAHCLYNGSPTHGTLKDAKDIKVLVGSALRAWRRARKKQVPDPQVQHANVARVVSHNLYRGEARSFADDIGLLILEEPVTMSASVEPACVDWNGSKGPVLAEGSVGRWVGWGLNLTDPESHRRMKQGSVLLEADMPYVPFDNCSKILPSNMLPYFTNPDKKFCAGHSTGVAIALGDGGGGLVFERDGRWFLQGLASLGPPQRPTFGLFTYVNAYSRWIEEFVRQSGPQSSQCGRYLGEGKAIVANSRNAAASESPWHVGLYQVSRNFKQFCGGTLVHPRLVVTAAHCLYNGSVSAAAAVVDAKDIKVSIGSAMREWRPVQNQQTSTRQPQHVNVARVVPHNRYRGEARSFADDIGLLILEEPVTVSASVEPACVDWNGSKGPVLAEGSVGRWVGWGKQTTNPSSDLQARSSLLLAADLPYIPYENCSDVLPYEMHRFLTDPDLKFCAGHANGARVARGDSGGGLAFERDGQWFLEGVASVGNVEEAPFYVLFTNVSAYSGWIQGFIKELEQAGTLPGTQRLDSGPRADSVPLICGTAPKAMSTLTVNGKKSPPGAFPWHAALYRRQGAAINYTCGGSLVSSKFIVTAAHCFFDYGRQLSAEQFAVALGKIYSSWSDDEGGVVQRSNVSRVLLDPLYCGAKRNLANDVALIEMETEATFSEYIVPICIDYSIAMATDDLIWVAGWGNGRGKTPLTQLESVVMKLQTLESCVIAINRRTAESAQITGDKFCAFREADVEQAPAPGLIEGDSGGGAVIQRGDRWFVVGVVSSKIDNEKIYTFSDMRKVGAWMAQTLSDGADHRLGRPACLPE